MTNLIGMILGMHHNICGVSHDKKIPVFDPYNLFDLNNKMWIPGLYRNVSLANIG